MTLICLTLVISCCLFTAMPALAEWAEGYLEIRAVYDIQISTGYNDVYEESDLPKDRYELVTEFLTANAIDTVYDHTLDLYLTRHDDFYNRVKLDFPVVAISLSDYNALREMQGVEPISLKENEFTTQWQTIATAEDKSVFLDSHKTVSTDAGNYQLAESSCYTDLLGETLYNTYTDAIYVFPDSACEKFLPVMRDRFIVTEESISYDSAKALESSFLQKYPEGFDTNTGVQYYFQMRTLQINEIKASIFI